MPRKARYLTGVTEGTWPHKVICAAITTAEKATSDTEKIVSLADWSIVILERDATCQVYTVSEKRSGESAANFWLEVGGLLSRNRKTPLYFNGALRALTISGFWQLLESDEWTTTDSDSMYIGGELIKGKTKFKGVCICDDPPTIIHCRPRWRKGTLQVLDVRNFGVSCADTSEIATVASMKLAKFVLGFLACLRRHNLGSPQSTAASQAITAFRHTFLRNIILVHDNEAALKLERDALFSGRCECRSLGIRRIPTYNLDSSSHYAGAVSGRPVPARLAGYNARGYDLLGKVLDKGYLAIAEVGIDARSNAYPYRVGQSLIFPCGKFWTVLCGPELQHAIDDGAISNVGRIAWYEGEEVFTDWSRKLWEARLDAKTNGRVWEEQTIKRLIVALFGKFAQHSYQWIDSDDQVSDLAYDSWYGAFPRNVLEDANLDNGKRGKFEDVTHERHNLTRWRSIGWRTQYENYSGEHRNSCPAITAWVYSLARMQLWEWIQCCLPENSLYCDTDSIMATEEGYRRLLSAGHIAEGVLGKLRIKDVYSWVHFYGMKNYEHDKGSVFAGIRGTESARVGNDYTGWVNERLESSTKRGMHPTCSQRRITKSRSERYTAGIVKLNGMVEPIRLEENIERTASYNSATGKLEYSER